jgi:hypothetical protein
MTASDSVRIQANRLADRNGKWTELFPGGRSHVWLRRNNQRAPRGKHGRSGSTDKIQSIIELFNYNQSTSEFGIR